MFDLHKELIINEAVAWFFCIHIVCRSATENFCQVRQAYHCHCRHHNLLYKIKVRLRSCWSYLQRHPYFNWWFFSQTGSEGSGENKKNLDSSYWPWSTPWGRVLSLKHFCQNPILSWAIHILFVSEPVWLKIHHLN